MPPTRLFPLVALLGCDVVPAGDVEPYAVVDSAGIAIIESSAPAWGEPARVEAEPRLRIGGEEPGPHQLAFVHRGLLLSEGRIGIAEGQEVRVFDPAGQHLRTLGRPGRGPGEFQSVTGLFELEGDSVAVFDQRLRRATIFSLASGEHRVLPSQLEGNYTAFGALADGRLLLYSPGRGLRPDLEPGLQWVPTDIVSVDPADGTPRVIARLPAREQLIEPGGNTGVVVPGRWAVHAVASDGFYWATPERYEIGFYDARGTLKRLLRRPVEPQAVTPGLVEEYVEGELARVRRFEGEEAVPRYRRLYEQATYGRHVPLFGTAFVDRDERLWISGPIWPALERPPRRWSVFSPHGVWLGEVEAPERLNIVDSRGDAVLGIWRDELDVPYVQVHRLVEG